MNIWRHFGDRTWCAPCEDMFDLEWRLRHRETVDKRDALAAASIINCYRQMVSMSERERRDVLREVRRGPSAQTVKAESR